jgi:hypothetical protein
MQVEESVQQVSVSDLDRVELAKLVRRVVSDNEFRARFQADPQDAIDHSGVNLSPVAASALVKNAKLGADLTVDMDSVASAFFFFFAA